MANIWNFTCCSIGQNVEILQVALLASSVLLLLSSTYPTTVDLIPLKKGTSLIFYLNPNLFENSEPILQSAGMIGGTGTIGSAVPFTVVLFPSDCYLSHVPNVPINSGCRKREAHKNCSTVIPE